MASVAICTAVVNPNVMSVPTMSLSMVFGTPTMGRLKSWNSLQATVSDPLPPTTTRPSIPMSLNVAATCSGPSGLVVRAAAPGAQQGAALRQHAAQRPHVERHRSALAHAIPRVEEPDQLVAIVELALANDRPNDRVESGAITATCQNADAHVCKG